MYSVFPYCTCTLYSAFENLLAHPTRGIARALAAAEGAARRRARERERAMRAAGELPSSASAAGSGRRGSTYVRPLVLRWRS